jgi:hypothetical protein
MQRQGLTIAEAVGLAQTQVEMQTGSKLSLEIVEQVAKIYQEALEKVQAMPDQRAQVTIAVKDKERVLTELKFLKIGKTVCLLK